MREFGAAVPFMEVGVKNTVTSIKNALHRRPHCIAVDAGADAEVLDVEFVWHWPVAFHQNN
jgi:hypothetical protein